MSSSLIPEKTITLSPSLAATIGLEEAILLQILNDSLILNNSVELKRGYQWATLDSLQLSALLPFWSGLDLQRIAKSLSDKGVILLDSAPYQQSQQLHFAINEKSEPQQQTPAAAPPISQPNSSPQWGANYIAPNWQPDTEVLAKLAQHNIDAQFSYSQCAEFITYWRERKEVSHSWGAKFIKHVLRAWRHHQQDTRFTPSNPQEPTQLNMNWRPSEDATEILERSGIHRNFIEDAIPEFTLYWQERGDANTTWNSKFLSHIKRQWARYTSALSHDTEPRRIPANWQPDNDVYDIIQMANIDREFAGELLKEFVLFWKDSNQLHSSWNTKFLQHVKYHWANQHQMITSGNGSRTGQSYAGQQKSNKAGRAQPQGFIEKHTDRSWADGL